MGAIDFFDLSPDSHRKGWRSRGRTRPEEMEQQRKITSKEIGKRRKIKRLDEFMELINPPNSRNRGIFVLNLVKSGQRVVFGINIFKGSHVVNQLFIGSHVENPYLHSKIIYIYIFKIGNLEIQNVCRVMDEED